METEEILYGNRSSPSLGGYHGHQSDNAKHTAIRTSFFALRNNILEELKNTNSDTVRLICSNSSTQKTTTTKTTKQTSKKIEETSISSNHHNKYIPNKT